MHPFFILPKPQKTFLKRTALYDLFVKILQLLAIYHIIGPLSYSLILGNLCLELTLSKF